MALFEPTQLNGMLCFDIETAPLYESFSDLSMKQPRLAAAWLKKHKKINPDAQPADTWKSHASFHAEFSQIVCVSFGRIVAVKKGDKEEYKLQVRSYYQNEETNEAEMLRKVADFFSALHSKSNFKLCGHNIKKFDLVFMLRRMVILGLPIHIKLRMWNTKPWESEMLDTMEAWNMGVFGADNASLDLLTAVFDIPSPKGFMDGSQVMDAFFKKEYTTIAEYCEEDVVATARVAMNMGYKSHTLLTQIDRQ